MHYNCARHAAGAKGVRLMPAREPMSAIDPLKGAQKAHPALKTVDPPVESAPESGAERSSRRRPNVLKCSYRPSDANFFCWKYGVWYNLMDCCYRHDRRTFSGCSGCGQGASNLRSNRARYHASRPPGNPPRASR
jgi:hypothetical protein